MSDIDWKNLERRSLSVGEQPKCCPDWGIARKDERAIYLVSLHQYYIYSGHLLGAMHHPRDEVEAAVAKARKLHSCCEAEPVVLPPTLLEYSLTNMPMRIVPIDEDIGPVTLPRVASIALLDSYTIARDTSCCFSSLVVVWFQDVFGDATDTVKQQIAMLEWNALAFDWMP